MEQRQSKLDIASQHYRAAVDEGRASARTHLEMAVILHHHEFYGNALKCYDLAIQLGPTDSQAHCRRADLLATCPDARYRDGSRAVADAERAVELAHAAGEWSSEWTRLLFRRVLAAAHAEAGDCERALRMLQHDAAEASTATSRREIKPHLDTLSHGHPIRSAKGIARVGIGVRRDA